jgi:hypothetical protein
MILSNVLYNDSVKKNRFMLILKQKTHWTNIDKNQFTNTFVIVSPNATVNRNPLTNFGDYIYRENEGYRDTNHHYSLILLTFFFLAFLFSSIHCVRYGAYIHDVHCACLSDFSVRDDARRHFSRQVAQYLSQEVPTVK